ncbi:MAG: hypothetical protein AAGA48_28910 [Myxococcota bacterium]
MKVEIHITPGGVVAAATLLIAGMLLVGGLARAGSVGLIVFEPDTPIRASSMNDNFAYLANEDDRVAADAANGLDLRASAIEANVSTHDAEITDLQKTTAAQADLNVVEGRVTTLEGTTGTVQTDLGNVVARVTTLEGDVSTLQKDVGVLQSATGTLQTDVNTLQGQVSMLEGDVSDLRADVNQLQADFAALPARDINWVITEFNDVNDNNERGAQCPTGEMVLSGGCQVAGAGLIYRNFPDNEIVGSPGAYSTWKCAIDSSNNTTLHVYAGCIPNPNAP